MTASMPHVGPPPPPEPKEEGRGRKAAVAAKARRRILLERGNRIGLGCCGGSILVVGSRGCFRVGLVEVEVDG